MLEQIFEKYNLDFSKVEEGVYKNNNLSINIDLQYLIQSKELYDCYIITNSKDVIYYIFSSDYNGNMDVYYNELKNRGYKVSYEYCKYHDEDDFMGTLFLAEEL